MVGKSLLVLAAMAVAGLAGCAAPQAPDSVDVASDPPRAVDAGRFLVEREMAVRARQKRAENLSQPGAIER